MAVVILLWYFIIAFTTSKLDWGLFFDASRFYLCKIFIIEQNQNIPFPESYAFFKLIFKCWKWQCKLFVKCFSLYLLLRNKLRLVPIPRTIYTMILLLDSYSLTESKGNHCEAITELCVHERPIYDINLRGVGVYPWKKDPPTFLLGLDARDH